MKKLALFLFSCGFLAAILIFFFIASIYPRFHVSSWRWNNRTCTRHYVGASKGMIWERGEWHHYVDFTVDDSISGGDWMITDAPMESTVWGKYSSSSVVRVTYRWPSNWWDPFPASNWKICLLSA